MPSLSLSAASKQPFPKPYSAVLIGSGGVGKSSMTLRFVYDDFQEAYDPTRADSYRKTLPDGREIDILDTAGQEQYAAVRAKDNYYRSGEGFLLVFALNDPSSLHAIPHLYAQLRRALDSPTPPPCLLIGNKSDLPVAIRRADIDAVLRGIQAEYVETSAKRDENVDEAFMRLVGMIDATRSGHSVAAASKKGRSSRRKKRHSRCVIN